MRARNAFPAFLAIPAVLSMLAVPLAAQARPAVTAADYQRARTFLRESLGSIPVGGTVAPTWLPDGRFWYRGTGSEVILVDPAKKARIACAADRANCPGVPDSSALAAQLQARRPTGRAGRTPAVPSPDGTKAAFIRDWNLWVRDVASGAETQLTTDGVPDFGYATDNAGWVHSDRAVLKWSPDSRLIATQQQDDRKVGEWFLVKTKAGHPELMRWKYPLPGDSVVSMVHRVVIDVEARRVLRLKMAPDFHRATDGDDLNMDDYQWSPDGLQLALASTPRDHKGATVRLADTRTGEVRDVLAETVATQFESRTGWRVLWGSGELLWYSQRDNWGQLYLYDLRSGQLKQKVTSGEGPVTAITRIDEKARTLWYEAMGREPGQDPYFAHLYRVGLDGRNVVSLTPELGDHTVQPSPDGKWVIDTYSQPDVPPVSVLRDAMTGKVVLPLEKGDVSKLVARGWVPPVPVRVKAADGVTDLYGLMWKPSNLDPSRKYPIINHAYPGPQTGSVGPRSFLALRGDNQALAELGFIVVSIDGRGTPGRSKSFHDAYYGAMGRDNTLPDQVAAMKELASRHGWIDIDRAAMWGHSGGGFITADALLRHPDFFKVGIAESGNHDQRLYEDDWGERYQGLLVRGPDGSDNYAPEANQSLAANLKGKLMLAHGTLDDNVPPDNTLVLAEALIKAGKDFDLVMIPNAAHGYGAASNWMMKKRWDYFVHHLYGQEPPAEATPVP